VASTMAADVPDCVEDAFEVPLRRGAGIYLPRPVSTRQSDWAVR